MRPALIKRTLQSTLAHNSSGQQRTFYACWEHAEKLEGAVNVCAFMPAPHQDVVAVNAGERDDAGVCCDFCE